VCNGREEEGILKLISVDSAMWGQKEMLFILVYGFLFTFLNYAVPCSTVQPVGCKAITCNRPGSVDV
jgi:hypothetical protein